MQGDLLAWLDFHCLNRDALKQRFTLHLPTPRTSDQESKLSQIVGSIMYTSY